MNECVCDRLSGALDSCISDVHSYFNYRFFQELCDLRLGRFTVESCYHCLSLILINMFFFDNFTSVFIFFIHNQDFSFYVRDSFIELHIPVISFFFHFHDG